MKTPFGESSTRLLLIGLIVLTIALAFYVARILLVPFVAALFLAYLYEPAVLRLERRRMDRGYAFLLLLGVTLVGLAVMVTFSPSWIRLESLGGSESTFASRLEQRLLEIDAWIDSRFPMLRSVDVAALVSGRVATFASHFFEELPTVIGTLTLNLLLVPFIAYFMIRDGRRLKNRLVTMVPNRYFEMTLMMVYRIDHQVGGYLRGRLIESLLVGVVTMIGMGVASIFAPQPQIVLISAVTAVTNMIPYLGPVLSIAFSVFLYIGTGMPMMSVYLVILVGLVAQLLDNVFIAPVVLSHNVDLHPLTIALVCVIGGELLGALGLLIAVPITSAAKVIAQEFYQNYRLQAGT